MTTTHFVLEAHKRLRHDPRVVADARARFLARCHAGDLADIVSAEARTLIDALLEATKSVPRGTSLEDLAGALAMRALGIRRVWASDGNFRRLGFEVRAIQVTAPS